MLAEHTQIIAIRAAGLFMTAILWLSACGTEKYELVATVPPATFTSIATLPPKLELQSTPTDMSPPPTLVPSPTAVPTLAPQSTPTPPTSLPKAVVNIRTLNVRSR